MDMPFCLEALEQALRGGRPEIFNTDQGAQCMSQVFTERLRQGGIQISMDGKGRCLDNVFVERLWRSVKYEEVYLHAYDGVAEARAGIGRYLTFYNEQRPQRSIAGRTRRLRDPRRRPQVCPQVASLPPRAPPSCASLGGRGHPWMTASRATKKRLPILVY